MSKAVKGLQTAIEVESEERKEVPKKVQKISKSYTVKSFGNVVEKLKTIGFLTEEEVKLLEGVKKSILEKYMNEF